MGRRKQSYKKIKGNKKSKAQRLRYLRNKHGYDYPLKSNVQRECIEAGEPRLIKENENESGIETQSRGQSAYLQEYLKSIKSFEENIPSEVPEYDGHYSDIEETIQGNKINCPNGTKHLKDNDDTDSQPFEDNRNLKTKKSKRLRNKVLRQKDANLRNFDIEKKTLLVEGVDSKNCELIEDENGLQIILTQENGEVIVCQIITDDQDNKRKGTDVPENLKVSLPRKKKKKRTAIFSEINREVIFKDNAFTENDKIGNLLLEWSSSDSESDDENQLITEDVDNSEHSDLEFTEIKNIERKSSEIQNLEKGSLAAQYSEEQNLVIDAYNNLNSRNQSIIQADQPKNTSVKMPKKKSEPDPPEVLEPRTTRRAASKAALQNMARISATYIDDEDDPDDPSENYEALSDDEDIAEEVHHKKKKYSLSHRKSSDGNDRDVLVLKTIAPPEKKPPPIILQKEKPSMPPPPAPDKPRIINWNEECLKLDAWAEELSPCQLERHNKVNKEIEEINIRIQKLIKESGCEVIYEGTNCAAYDVGKGTTAPTPIATTPTTKPVQKNQLNTVSSTTTTPAANNAKSTKVQLVMDPKSGVVVGTVTPTTPVTMTQHQINAQRTTRKRTTIQPPTPTIPPKITKPNPVVTNQTRTPEASSPAGGRVVDLTEDGKAAAADSREVSFNKLQGKTFPSLVVVARPHLRVKEGPANDRPKLDAKVKAVLMHVPTKFTEWLIQQGLIRSEQNCATHPQSKLKLGMYSDVTKFPFSGGYVWISECCPLRFVSVFSGSLFEGSPYAPSVILKLIYHWACQTNVQNVVQWVKVDNLYVKGLNTWLRAACTVALHTHIGPLGGLGCKVEVGVISLGTTSQDGSQRQVKVEVLGLLETDLKRLRLRAVEPLADGDRNYKKRFSKILEPLLQWVHPESTIVTDLTVDKTTLHSMGFRHVVQGTNADSSVNNHTVMEYLRKIVPRMFQNTLSLLSRQIIQQFLDELVWREWFGVTAAQAFDNMVLHLSEQTKAETGQSFIMRLNKVAANPFKNWSIKANAINPAPKLLPASVQESPPSQQKRSLVGRPRKPPPVKQPSPQPELRVSRPISPDVPKQMVPLENYYYGTIESEKIMESNVVLNLKCSVCRSTFNNNIKLMDHLFTHCPTGQNGPYQCHYCLHNCGSKDLLSQHIVTTHPADTRFNDKFACLICEIAFDNSYLLGEHMSKEHNPSELPYLCGTCGYRCSSHKQAIDHFYLAHDGGNTIQCPYCLRSTVVYSSGRMVVQNLNYFLQHLNKHQKKALAKKCNNCTLWFVQKEHHKDHLKLHETVRYNPGLQSWPVPKANAIMVPKSDFDYQDMEEKELDLNNLVIELPDSMACKECKTSMSRPGHYPTLQSCPNTNCRYTTCCISSMQEHIKQCRVMVDNLPKNILPITLYCVCGFSSNDGYVMAKHLAVCERKSAYPSKEAAKAATVTHSMLDVLGLVRRPEEPPNASKHLEVMELDSEDENSGFPIEPVVEISEDASKKEKGTQPTSGKQNKKRKRLAEPEKVDNEFVVIDDGEKLQEKKVKTDNSKGEKKTDEQTSNKKEENGSDNKKGEKENEDVSGDKSEEKSNEEKKDVATNEEVVLLDDDVMEVDAKEADETEKEKTNSKSIKIKDTEEDMKTEESSEKIEDTLEKESEDKVEDLEPDKTTPAENVESLEKEKILDDNSVDINDGTEPVAEVAMDKADVEIDDTSKTETKPGELEEPEPNLEDKTEKVVEKQPELSEESKTEEVVKKELELSQERKTDEVVEKEPELGEESKTEKVAEKELVKPEEPKETATADSKTKEQEEESSTEMSEESKSDKKESEPKE